MKVLNRVINIFLSLFGVLVLLILVKVFAFDYFPVNTVSMIPTVQPGDRILVNKMIFGARIYKSLDFEDGKALESWRMPGWRKIRHNDIIVFNFVQGKEEPRDMTFNFSTVYVKRCIGLPGDTISIRGGFFHNTATDKPLGLLEAQAKLASITDFWSLWIFPLRHTPAKEWNIMNMGPLYIPRKGDVIEVRLDNYHEYQTVIEYERQGRITRKGDRLFLDGEPVYEHEILNNYYFVCGDNLVNSIDSRSWGFVPEDFIIGVSPRVFYSKNADNTINWSRLFHKF